MRRMLNLLAWGAIMTCAADIIAAVPIHGVTVTPTQLFTSEEKALLFTAAVHGSADHAPVTIVLLQLDASGESIVHRWNMRDDGTFGDRAAGDGIYSRKVEFKPYRPVPLHFAVYPERQEAPLRPRDRVPSDLVEDQQFVGVEVVAQPTFLELMSRIWHTLFASGGTP